MPRRLTTAAGPKRARTSTLVRMSRGSASKRRRWRRADRRARSSGRSPSADRTCRRPARGRWRAGCRAPRGAASSRCSRRRRGSRRTRAAGASAPTSPASKTGSVTTGFAGAAPSERPPDAESDGERHRDPGVVAAPCGTQRPRASRPRAATAARDRQRVDRQIRHLQRQIRHVAPRCARGRSTRRPAARSPRTARRRCGRGARSPTSTRPPAASDDERPGQRPRRRPDREPDRVDHVEPVDHTRRGVDRGDASAIGTQREREIPHAGAGHARSRARQHDAASVSTSGPIQIGQVRNAAAPNSANNVIVAGDGRSLHSTIVHHIATANSSRHDLRQERLLHERADEERVRQPQQQHRDDANGRRGTPSGISRRAIRKTNRVFSATVSATTAWTTCSASRRSQRADEHGQQVEAGRVVDHLAEVHARHGVVRQAAVLLDEGQEREVMREIGTAAGRQEVGPRAPHQPRERAERRCAKAAAPGGRAIAAPAEPQPHRRGGRSTATAIDSGASAKPSRSAR